MQEIRLTDQMTGIEFENYLRYIFKRKDFMLIQLLAFSLRNVVMCLHFLKTIIKIEGGHENPPSNYVFVAYEIFHPHFIF